MRLRRLSMALTLARFEDGGVRVAAAGMPPPLLLRAGSRRVEAIELAGLPLGTAGRLPYRETRVPLAPGDTVLLMSDGFPERLDPDDELFGYDRAEQAFAATAGLPPTGVVARLLERQAEWSRGRPLDDDVTFVVVRVRE